VPNPEPLERVFADWPAPNHIHAFSTTRKGGVSQKGYTSLNLGARCGDDPQCVAQNRRQIEQFCPRPPLWLQQVHGIEVYEWIPGAEDEMPSPQADAIWTQQANTVCAVLTADCLPVLFCDQKGTRVGAAHAGWKGLLHGVLERTVDSMQCAPGQILAWMGPAISQAAFEVGPEVREAFMAVQAQSEQAFIPGKGDRWHADLYALARMRLAAIGVHQVFGEPICTFADDQRFYSFRRDGTTGRMANLIWMEGPV